MSRSFFRSFAFLFFALTFLSSTTGCAEVFMWYRYISLQEVPGIDVVREEEPNLKHLHIFEGAFPTGYTLKRPAYRIDFRVGTAKFAPHVWIEASTEAGKRLSLKSRSDSLSQSGRTRPCGTYSSSQPADELRFDWVICGTDAAPNEFVIAFDVLDADGAVVGRETLPFKLEKNGFYFSPDGP